MARKRNPAQFELVRTSVLVPIAIGIPNSIFGFQNVCLVLMLSVLTCVRRVFYFGGHKFLTSNFLSFTRG